MKWDQTCGLGLGGRRWRELLAPRWLAVLCICALGAGCVTEKSAPPVSGRPDDQFAIRQLLEETFDAAARKDFPRLDSYHAYGPKFSKFSADSPHRQNAEEARQGEHEGLAAVDGMTMRADDLKVDVFGDAALATFVLDYAFEVEGRRIAARARATMAFVREGGVWLITHEHFSPIQARPGAPAAQ